MFYPCVIVDNCWPCVMVVMLDFTVPDKVEVFHESSEQSEWSLALEWDPISCVYPGRFGQPHAYALYWTCQSGIVRCTSDILCFYTLLRKFKSFSHAVFSLSEYW